MISLLKWVSRTKNHNLDYLCFNLKNIPNMLLQLNFSVFHIFCKYNSMSYLLSISYTYLGANFFFENSEVVNNTNPRTGHPDSFCHLLYVWFCINFLTFIRFSFSINKINIFLILRNKWQYLTHSNYFMYDSNYHY